MSSELALIFANIFDDLFVYDEKYNELKFIADISSETVTEIVTKKPKGIRDIWYRCYPAIMAAHSLNKTYSMNDLLTAIEKDDGYDFIPNSFIMDDMRKNHIFRKIIEQDYLFEKLMEDNDRRHFKLDIPILYEDGLNFNKYAEKGFIDLSQVSKYLNFMDIKWTIKYANDGHSVAPYVRRIYMEDTIGEDLFEQLNEKARKEYAEIVTTQFDNIMRFKILDYCDIIGRYNRFRMSEPDMSGSITQKIASLWTDDEKVQERIKNTFDYCIQYLISSMYLKLVIKYGTIAQKVRVCMNHDAYTADVLLQMNSDIVIPYCYELIKMKTITPDNIQEYVEKYGILSHADRFDLGFAWVETYKEEPPLCIYPNPNYVENLSKDKTNPISKWRTGRNIKDAWSVAINASTIPQEMCSMKYYDYMVKSNGVKRNPKQTIMYSFFSNSSENKLVFCRSDVELLDPAVPRWYIPVEFKSLKRYLHEDLITTDICMFSQLTKNDWEKISRGKDDIDVVVFCDNKNIYRERTPLKTIIKYVVDNINIEFDVECNEAQVDE